MQERSPLQQLPTGKVQSPMSSVSGSVATKKGSFKIQTKKYFFYFQVFRVSSMTSTTPISGVGVVSVAINIADVNDNAPQILNPLSSALSISEVILAIVVMMK